MKMDNALKFSVIIFCIGVILLSVICIIISSCAERELNSSYKEIHGIVRSIPIEITGSKTQCIEGYIFVFAISRAGGYSVDSYHITMTQLMPPTPCKK